MLLEDNLIKGGDLNNAIVYVDKKISDDTMEKLKKAFNRDKVKVKPNGILDNLTFLKSCLRTKFIISPFSSPSK